MKKFYIIFIFLFSCDSLLITDEDLKKEKESPGKPNSEIILVSKNDFQIVEKDFGVGKNYFFQFRKSNQKFLFLTCSFDCNEKLELYSFSDDLKSFAFLTKNRSRIKTKNRLILYKIGNNKPIELLDTVKEVNKTFRFENNKFVYVLESGVKKSIELN